VNSFPTDRGKNSGMCSIAMRVPKIEDDKFQLRLERHDNFPNVTEKGEVHYLLTLIEDDSLWVLKEAIDKYLNEI
jgi:hypothetical protein